MILKVVLADRVADAARLKVDTVTVRDRDSLKQERIKVPELTDYLREKMGFG